jgi:hypothetical protein
MRILADVLVRPNVQFSLDPHQPLEVLRTLTGLGSFVCFLIVLVRLFQTKGLLHGALGILSFGLYPFIWGWIARKEAGTRKVMPVWAVLAVGFILLDFGGPRPPRPLPYPLPTPPANRAD